MLSTRGQNYANSGLMSGYEGEMKEPYHKASYPNGEISFSSAENVITHTHNALVIADWYKFLMKEEIMCYINTKVGSFRVILSGRLKTDICY
jgi:1-aminocyclopropane-1-carboxylate synthase